MASSPPTSPDLGAGGDVAFALEELAACWQQAYEAMTRGDLDAALRLVDVADEHAHAAGDGAADTPAEKALRQRAATGYGMLQHAIRTGMSGVEAELRRARQGQRALRGYDRADATGRRLERDA